MLVAADAVVANDAEPIKDPVNDPLLTWVDDDTSVGLFNNVLKSAAETLLAYDAVTAYEADVTSANCAEDETTVGLLLIAFQSVPAYELDAGRKVIDVAADAVAAKDAVVIDPENDPVLICADDETNVGLFVNVLKSAAVTLLA